MCNKHISLSENQKQLIYGSLLGDGYYYFEKDRLKITHSNKQYEYLLWKYQLLELHTKIYKREIIKSQDKIYTSYTLEVSKTYLQDILPYIHKNLYSKTSKRKKISLQFLNNLSPLALAVWWMDDGHLSVHKGNRYGKLSTNSFNYEEHILMQKYFKEKWDIDVDIRKEKDKYYFVRFNVKAMQKFISIIYEYVCEIPSMIYKIDLNYVNDLQLNRFYDDFDKVYWYIKDKIE